MNLMMRWATASALLLLPQIIGSQEAAGTVTGRILDATDSLAVGGAEVHVTGVRSARSNGRGVFTIPSVPAGARQISVDIFGYEPFLDRLELAAGQTVTRDIYLTRDTTLLSQMKVKGRSLRVPAGFEDVYDRAAEGRGLLITREQIDSLHPRDLIALLREVPDVRINPNSSDFDRIWTSQCRPTIPGSAAGFNGQLVQVIYNGAPVTQRAFLNDVLSRIAPSLIQAIEVYDGSITVPPRFQPACGVIAIWTRKQ